uniref:Putative neural cell adhesion molecule l1 n=1 Tax=Corethrella appendiculata TaxID=1370023 RepID=W4VR48_9DIPT
MALLFRFGIVFTIGILFLNGFLQSVSGFINEEGADSRLKLLAQPPAHIIATPAKNSPVYLPCHAVYNYDEDEINYNDNNNDYDVDEYEDDNDDGDDGDDESNNDLEEDDISELVTINSNSSDRQKRIHELYSQQFSDHDKSNNIRGGQNDFFNSNTNHHNSNDLDEENYDEEEDESKDDFRNFRSKRSLYSNHRRSQQLPIIQYTWYRNGAKFMTTAFQNSNPQQSLNGFRLFNNGTLRIQYSNMTSGVYRCLANETRYGKGAILSTQCIVNVSIFQRDPLLHLSSANNTIKISVGQPIVLNCPFQSYPKANVTWFFNKSQIEFDGFNKLFDNRHFLLQNDSLLIVDTQSTDAGKYRCNATNNFAPKNTRSAAFTLEIQENRNKFQDGLLPILQDNVQKIKTGDTLKLHCASYSNKINWTFTPYLSTIPIKLINISTELKYVNVSINKHQGIYNCSSGNDHHLFDVKIISPPIFLQEFKSITSSVVATVSYNCSVSGSPPPHVAWYKNGREIKNTFVTHYEYPTLKIHSIDPEDEGLYQCFARNEVAEISTSHYLSIRNKNQYKQMPKRLENVKCFPIDSSTLFVKFDTRDTLNYVIYYMSSENPFSWLSASPTTILGNNSIKISGNLIPFKPYAIFLRGLAEMDARTTNLGGGDGLAPGKKIPFRITRLSKAVKCATQGLRIQSAIFPNGIFIWWPNSEQIGSTSFTIQFWHNDSTNPTIFSKHIIGTYAQLDDYMSYQEIEPSLMKIVAATKIIYSKFKDLPLSEKRRKRRRRRSFDFGASAKQILDSLQTTPITNNTMSSSSAENSATTDKRNFQNITITEVRVPGNVTGILIPNSNRIVVRVLGSLSDDGEPLDQDLRFVQWKTIDWTTKNPDTIHKFQATDIEAHSIKFTWNNFLASEEQNQCLQICYKNMNEDFIVRTSKTIECQEINKDVSYFYLQKLPALTLFKIFLKSCHGDKPLSSTIDVQTKQDVPGPVTRHDLIKKDDGVKLIWGPPENPNGKLLYYFIEWINKDLEYNAVNISLGTHEFKFPNITAEEKFNISIRAIGNTGAGIPIYLNLFNQNYDFNSTTNGFKRTSIEVVIGMLIAILLIIIFIACFFMRKRTCKKNLRTNSNQPSLPPAATTATGTNNDQQIILSSLHTANTNFCNTEIHEMQTLISKAEQLSPILPNGKHKSLELMRKEICSDKNEKQIPKNVNNLNDSTTLPLLSVSITQQDHQQPITSSSSSSGSSSTFSSFSNGNTAATNPSVKLNGCIKMPIIASKLPPSSQSSAPLIVNSSKKFVNDKINLPPSTTTSSIENKNTNSSLIATIAKTNHNHQNYDINDADENDGQDDGKNTGENSLLKQKHSSKYSPKIVNNNFNTNVRITENPQYLTNENNKSTTLNSSIFDDSQQKLLDLTIDSTQNNNEDSIISDETINNNNNINNYNGNNFNDNLNNINNEVILGGNENLDEDDEDEDGSLNNSSLLLNDSNLSTKPLHEHHHHHTSNWNFRRPIIGPNG